MYLFEIASIVILIIITRILFQILEVMDRCKENLDIIKMGLLNFEKIVFDDNFEIKTELRYKNKDKSIDSDYLEKVRRRDIRRDQ